MLFKVVLLGDVAVGKTTLRRSYMGEVLIKNYVKTLGFDFAIKQHEAGTVQIWDIAGEMSLNSVGSFIKNSCGVLLLFDLTNPSTLKRTYIWLNLIFEHLGLEPYIALVGNKTDLIEDNPIIAQDEIQSLVSHAKEYFSGEKVKYFETSALTSYGITNIFDWLIPSIAGDIDD